jgi:hypothetical protein
MCSALPFRKHSLVIAIFAVVTIIFKIIKDISLINNLSY